jgi:hypothetical protein
MFLTRLKSLIEAAPTRGANFRRGDVEQLFGA